MQTDLLSAFIRVGHSLLGMNMCLQVLGGWPGHPGPGRGMLVLKAERQRWLFPGLWHTTPCYCGGSVLLSSFPYLLFDGRKRVLRVRIRKRLNALRPKPDLCSDHCWHPRPCHLCLVEVQLVSGHVLRSGDNQPGPSSLRTGRVWSPGCGGK